MTAIGVCNKRKVEETEESKEECEGILKLCLMALKKRQILCC